MIPHLDKAFSNPPALPPKFDSQEQYAPVFSSNSKDLEALEARVVEPATEFYTYLKAMRDYLRILSTVERPRNEVPVWQNAVQNVAYMTFLMLELEPLPANPSFIVQPEKAENTIMILLSEIVLFGLLLKCFEGKEGDVPGCSARLERLRLRKETYLNLGPQLHNLAKGYSMVPGKDQARWQRAAALLGELNASYHKVFGEWLEPPQAFAR